MAIFNSYVSHYQRVQPTNRIQSWQFAKRQKRSQAPDDPPHWSAIFLGRPAGRATHGTRVAQDFPRWQRWKMFGKWLGKCLVKGWFKVSLGMCICLCLSTYISLSVPVTSFGLENAKIIKIEKWKNGKSTDSPKAEKVWTRKRQTRIVLFCFGCFPLYLSIFTFFFHYCVSPFFKVFFNFKLLHQKKMCTTKK